MTKKCRDYFRTILDEDEADMFMKWDIESKIITWFPYFNPDEHTHFPNFYLNEFHRFGCLTNTWVPPSEICPKYIVDIPNIYLEKMYEDCKLDYELYYLDYDIYYEEYHD